MVKTLNSHITKSVPLPVRIICIVSGVRTWREVVQKDCITDRHRTWCCCRTGNLIGLDTCTARHPASVDTAESIRDFHIGF